MSTVRALATAGGGLAVPAAVLTGGDTTAGLTVVISGLVSILLGYRIDRLRDGAAVQFYASAVCLLGATVAGQGYVALALGVSGERRAGAWLLVAAGALMVMGGLAQLALRPRRSA